MKDLALFLKRAYASADPRSLGIFRIALGALMFFDVLRRFPEIPSHFSNTGWLSNHFMLFRPMSEHLLSVYLAFSSPSEVRFLMTLHLAICVLFMIGWRTRLMHVLLVLLLVSINSRNIMVENGGYVALTALTIWTAFLPLGRRFSVDAVRASLRLRRENGAEALNDRSDPPRPTAPVVSLAVFALLAQWATIYALNVVHKNGPEWRDGTAVYYLFYQDRVITGFAEWARNLIPLGGHRALTYSGLVIEGLIALLLLSPVWTTRARLLAGGLAVALHLSIAAVVDLGPFSWAMMLPFIALAPASVWEALSRRFDRRFSRFSLLFDRESGFFIEFCRVVKRLDVLGHIRFVPVTIPNRGAVPPEPRADAQVEESDDEDSDEEEDEEEDDEAKPRDEASAQAVVGGSSELERLVARTLVVEDEKGPSRTTGIAAIFALGTAIPGGSLLCLPLRLPGIRGFVDRRLARASRHAALLDGYFEVDTLPVGPEVRPPEPSPARLALGRALGTLRESAVALLIVVCGVQVLIENTETASWLKRRQPTWMRAMVVYPRMFQGWSMFAPSPALSDGRLVVNGVTSDGRKLDPLTGAAPAFEVAPPSARHMNQIWGDFHRRVGDSRFEPYREGLKDFIRRHHDVVKRPADRLVAFEAWYVSETIPPPGQKKRPPERRFLFGDGVMPEGQGSEPLGPLR